MHLKKAVASNRNVGCYHILRIKETFLLPVQFVIQSLNRNVKLDHRRVKRDLLYQWHAHHFWVYEWKTRKDCGIAWIYRKDEKKCCDISFKRHNSFEYDHFEVTVVDCVQHKIMRCLVMSLRISCFWIHECFIFKTEAQKMYPFLRVTDW